MPKKSMTDKDVQKTHKARAYTPRTSPEYPAKKQAHEDAKAQKEAANTYKALQKKGWG